MGQKRGKGPGSFVGDTKQQTLDFYRDILQNVRVWSPKAPKLPDSDAAPRPDDGTRPTEVPQLVGTAHSTPWSADDPKTNGGPP